MLWKDAWHYYILTRIFESEQTTQWVCRKKRCFIHFEQLFPVGNIFFVQARIYVTTTKRNNLLHSRVLPNFKCWPQFIAWEKCWRTHGHIHTQRHTHAHAHAQTHARTQTHTHDHIASSDCFICFENSSATVFDRENPSVFAFLSNMFFLDLVTISILVSDYQRFISIWMLIGSILSNDISEN